MPLKEETVAYRTMAQMLESDDVSWDEEDASRFELPLSEATVTKLRSLRKQ